MIEEKGRKEKGKNWRTIVGLFLPYVIKFGTLGVFPVLSHYKNVIYNLTCVLLLGFGCSAYLSSTMTVHTGNRKVLEDDKWPSEYPAV